MVPKDDLDGSTEEWSEDDLWYEAPDVTANEEHQTLANWFRGAIRSLLPDPSAVIEATWLLYDRQRISADILVSVGSEEGQRPSWRVGVDPVPDVTIEILSPSNRSGEGLELVEQKRALLGRMGVPEHLELDPASGTVDVWISHDGHLVRIAHGLTRYLSTRLHGTVIERGDHGGLQITRPDGRVFPLPEQAYRALEEARQAAETARQAAETAIAERDRLRARLVAAGIDPDAD